MLINLILRCTYYLFICVIIRNGIVRFVVCEHAEAILVGFNENRG